ncbi:MAG: MSMEG_4193 family putative phosphomutase [Nocardioidaceae bacterium]
MILVRHGRTAANVDGVLAGRSPGVDLDDVGREQAAAVAARLSPLPVRVVVSSPLERTMQTATVIAKSAPEPLRVHRDRGLIECGYGTWTGRRLADLAKETLWRTVQTQPSAARFPDGESMPEMQHRALQAVRRWDAVVAAEHGPHALWVAVSHGDVIKAIIADALATHLDQFQRIVVSPASVTVISYTDARPYVVHVNDTGSDLAGLRPPTKRRRRRRGGDDAVVGGGA